MDKNQKKILISVAAVLVAILIGLSIFSKPADNNSGYTPPAFEENAVKGAPADVAEETNYKDLEFALSDNKICSVAFCITPKANGKTLDINFTNNEKCSAWVCVLVIDSDKNVIGRSGVLKQGQYVPSIELDNEVASGETYSIKIVTFEPDTYYSMGTATAQINIL